MRGCGAPSDDGLSINQAAELPMPSPPATMRPSLGSPMQAAMGIPPPMDGPIAPPSGYPPATVPGGGKAPATATGGYLQVRKVVGLWRQSVAGRRWSRACCCPAVKPCLRPRSLLPHQPCPPSPFHACPLAQVSSLQVYDELLESALKAGGCGPRNLALHGPWVWLLDRFCDAYAVGRNYARLSYLK